MPDQATLQRAQRDAQEGKSASTQAGEFVREEIHHIREGKHGARSAKQAIAIGLSEARRAGVHLPPSKSSPAGTKEKAVHDLKKGQTASKPSRTRSLAQIRALKKEGGAAASPRTLAKQARAGAQARGPHARSASAQRAAATRRRAAR